MAKLAIKKHETRGKEVIEILEMLGGHNKFNLNGNEDEWYVLDTKIYRTNRLLYDEKAFTIEEFLDKYPYKVGDKVSYVKYNDEYPSVYTIQKIRWTGATIEYLLGSSGFSALTKDLQPYKEETMEETDIIDHTTEINLNHPCFGKCNEIELIIPDGWEFQRRGNKMFGVRKQYPKTYEECCEIVNANPYVRLVYDVSNGQRYSYDVDELQHCENIRRLKICRDAYWKIAGKVFGLDKPWVPDWNDNTEKYVIYPYQYLYSIDKENYRNTILAFPTKEMRDAFFENFKDLIEECKEFL